MKINLAEILHPEMDILFVALNPPVNSNNNGHYFSNNMSFWNLLYNSGLITNPVISKLTGDDEIFRKQSINYKNAVYGITDLVHDKVETNSSKVSVEQKMVDRILEIINKRKINILCLMHSKVGSTFQEAGLIKRKPEYGQVGQYKETLIYEVPFHNASIAGKEKHYKLLKGKL
jgi:G:T/U-mismatch repair DNA glycosylase